METIAIDALGISQPGGGRSAVLNLLREVLRLDKSRQYVLLLDGPEPELAGFCRARQVCAPVPNRGVARAWAQVAWPVLLRRLRVDLVHHVKNLGAAGLPGKSVYTVFDLTMLRHPDIYSRAERVVWQYVQPVLLRRATHVVAISESTANDLVESFGLARERISVIYPGYDPAFAPLPVDAARELSGRIGLLGRYILHVGSISKKKNLLTLLRAFEVLCHEGYEGSLCLVGRRYETGHDTAFFEHLAHSPYRGRVVFTGVVSVDDLRSLYAAADVMIFPSLHEGFGIAPLEAMACGCPVVCSAGGALPEVVGNGGIIVKELRNPAAYAAAVRPLLSDPSTRQVWSRRGLERARRFSAREAARRTLNLYDRLLAAPGTGQVCP